MSTTTNTQLDVQAIVLEKLANAKSSLSFATGFFNDVLPIIETLGEGAFKDAATVIVNEIETEFEVIKSKYLSPSTGSVSVTQ